MENQRKTNKSGRAKLIIAALAVVVMAALVAVLVFQQIEIRRLNDPAASAEQAKADAKRLRDRVSKIQQVPDETPTLATVQDADKLREQEFFKDASNGDKVLIFTEAKKAIIYRESDNRVINSGPIVLNSSGNIEPTKTEE
ncbi:MAG: hypothetical protein LBC95_02870 [Candidatus Nomurabacteria bacterium]|jgi:lipopolysaccharide export LptBFGC system permease protein LptF|nr:hypothetical protein [Candidatus Nomurabacteria bacterium]